MELFTIEDKNAEYGVWCDNCLLPSVIRIPVSRGGVVFMWLSYCHDEEMEMEK